MRRARCFSVVVAVSLLVVIGAPAVFAGWELVDGDARNVWDIAFRAEDSDTAYAVDSYGIHRSLDGGLTWTEVRSYSLGYAVAVDPVNKNVAYAAFENQFFKTSDGGDTWTVAGGGLPIRNNPDCRPTDIAVNPAHPETVYCTTADFVGSPGMYRNIFDGNGWLYVELPSFYDTYAVEIDPENAGRMYVGAASWEGLFYRSLNSGAAWDSLLDEFVDDIAINPLDPDIVYAVTDGGLYRSQDGGDSWAFFDSDDGLVNRLYSVAVNPVNPTLVYVGARDAVYRSTDGGTTWSDFSEGLPDTAVTRVFSVAVDGEFGETLLIGTGGFGIFRRNESLSGIEPKRGVDQTVLRARPNPFRSETVISYHLPAPAKTSIAVYDVSGREIIALVNRSDTAGEHQASWNGRDRNGSQVGPGIYFVKIRSGQASAAKAIVLFR